MISTKPRHYSKHILLCIYQAWREKQQKPNISLLGSAPQRTLISVDRQTDHQSVNSSLTHLSKHWEDATSSSPGRWCVRPRLCVCVFGMYLLLLLVLASEASAALEAEPAAGAACKTHSLSAPPSASGDASYSLHSSWNRSPAWPRGSQCYGDEK